MYSPGDATVFFFVQGANSVIEQYRTVFDCRIQLQQYAHRGRSLLSTIAFFIVGLYLKCALEKN